MRGYGKFSSANTTSTSSKNSVNAIALLPSLLISYSSGAACICRCNHYAGKCAARGKSKNEIQDVADNDTYIIIPCGINHISENLLEITNTVRVGIYSNLGRVASRCLLKSLQ